MMLWLARETAALPHLDGTWIVTRQGQLELRPTHAADLEPYVGQRLVTLSGGAASVDLRDAALLQRSPRWLVDGATRARQLELHEEIAAALARRSVTLTFEDGHNVVRSLATRTIGDLPVQFWLRWACALALYLLSMAILLLRPSAANRLYVVIVLCQAGNLSFDAAGAAFDVGMPAHWLHAEFTVRAALDVIMSTALLHVACLWPRPLPWNSRWAGAGWGFAALCLTALLAQSWWSVQIAIILLNLAVLGLTAWSVQLEPRPLTLTLFRFAALATGLWVVLSVTLGSTIGHPWAQGQIAAAGSTIWYLLLPTLLGANLLFSRSEQFVREFGLLLAVGALAVALDLVISDTLGVDRWLAGALSLSIALSAYLGARKRLLERLLGIGVVTTERMFERLYRVAREVESQPQRTPKLLAEVLTELFDPLQVKIIQEPASRTRVTEDGSTMQVPVPAVAFDTQGYDGSIVLRFAQRGHRLFSADDIRLADRIVEQLERAVAYDRAVERGRGEERLRIAQDLHDDIGARLLTLIYKAESPEMEEYARHTLQDLKTLTRGLAASSHRLSHAAGEWKADLTHRLSAANMDLIWSCDFDDDVLLGTVQWSALTRVLRELVSNAIAHSMASRVEVSVTLEQDCMQLSVSDDGRGSAPKSWAHGLGLSGVRKRVKQLNGKVEWSDAAPHGICCRVVVQDFCGHSGT
ncbi:MAG: ATP-binding protein [Burkholderiaceae bacterium]